MPIEAISALIGLILTLLIFSYLIGDNPLFRLALYLFIGVASGYAAVVVWHSVLLPRLFLPLKSVRPGIDCWWPNFKPPGIARRLPLPAEG